MNLLYCLRLSAYHLQCRHVKSNEENLPFLYPISSTSIEVGRFTSKRISLAPGLTAICCNPKYWHVVPVCQPFGCSSLMGKEVSWKTFNWPPLHRCTADALPSSPSFGALLSPSFRLPRSLGQGAVRHGGSWIVKDKLKIFWVSQSLHSLVGTCDCQDCVHFMWILLIKDCYDARIYDLITEIDVKQLSHPKFLSQCNNSNQHVLILIWSSQLESHISHVISIWVQELNQKDDLQSVLHAPRWRKFGSKGMLPKLLCLRWRLSTQGMRKRWRKNWWETM